MASVDRLLLQTRITVSEHERVLVLKNGRFHDILRAGRHTVAGWSSGLEAITFDLTRPEFVSTYEAALFRERKDLADAHLTEVRTGEDEVAVIFRNERLFAVQRPEGRSVFWTDAGPWEVRRIEVPDDLMIDGSLARRLDRLARTDKVVQHVVGEGHKGLLYVDAALVRVLEPGRYGFWNVGRPVNVRVIDVRRHAAEVNGQEVLTKDRVTIRVNLSAEYTVTDVVRAVTAVTAYEQSLYRALQFGFRKAVGTRTLDELLADKSVVDTEVGDAVRADMAEIGLAVGEVSLKDVILPGEMREILNRVVAAEKEAQANVIRRREETAATRSLLNTAKVMADNPIMLRLKELEALESVAGKIGYLAVHNGTQGLLEDLVKLRADVPDKS